MLPVPSTGRASPVYDKEHLLRVVDAQKVLGEIWIEHPPQRAVIERIEALRQSTIGVRGRELPGLRLSQSSQAGKSRALRYYMSDLAQRMQAVGRPPNRFQVLYINLRVGVTMKMLCQQLLQLLGDPHWRRGNTEEVTFRMEAALLERGVELLIIDEVQWLANGRADCAIVTDQLKLFLNSGIVPLVLCGNEDSIRLFETNTQLASRLGVPLELSPHSTRDKSSAKSFSLFCEGLDDALVEASILPKPSQLARPPIVGKLLAVSGGHVGRVCRVIGAAVEHAIRRDAEMLEAFDLAHAVATFAIPAGYIARNPFGEL